MPQSTPEPDSKKSTNVRIPYQRSLRFVFRTLQTLAPPLAARAAGSLFRLSPRHRGSSAERETLATGRPGSIRDGKLRIATWSWGEGPAVLLVHGWGSRGGRLGSFVPPLLNAGYSVMTFDAPGHGESPGRLSSLPQFIASIEALSEKAGKLHGIVAHSMGCSASAVAMRKGLPLERAVFLAPSANPGAYLRPFTQILGLRPAADEQIRRTFENRFGYKWNDFDVPRMARGMETPLLVFHDRDDRDVPWSDGAAIAQAWPGAELVTTEGLGHRRIVHDSAVVGRAVAFLQQEDRAVRASG